MRQLRFPLFVFLSLLFVACSGGSDAPPPDSADGAVSKTEEKATAAKKEVAGPADAANLAETVTYSFVFVGCNRVEYGDWHNEAATNPTTANLSALKRIFNEIAAEEREPDLFFFLGDLVLAESSDINNLDDQLQSWVTQYRDPAFSDLPSSDIEMVAVPGNHEMLYYQKPKVDGHDEWPLKGSIDVWMEHMLPWIPEDRETITGPDADINQATFAFTRSNIGFIVMNTDTYNEPTKEFPRGQEGVIPLTWIEGMIEQYQQDENIDHIFVLGHKPAYVDGSFQTGHQGFLDSEPLFQKMQAERATAMLSAHVHDYLRYQPYNEGTYQVVAGQGGSKGTGAFFGYSVINIMGNGEVQLVTKGFDVGDPYYEAVPTNPTTERDNTILTWEANANPYTPAVN